MMFPIRRTEHLPLFTPNNPHAKEKIRKEVEMDLSHTYYPKHPLVPFIKSDTGSCCFGNSEGCIRGCQFCQAGAVYRPVRERSLAFLKKRLPMRC